MRVGIGLGSNVGDRSTEMAKARDWLRGLDPGAKFSSQVETEPVDCLPGTPSFLNQVAEIVWGGRVEGLLDQAQNYERSRSRKTLRLRNEPRRMDLDLLYAGDVKIRTSRLELPHPRMGKRRFVIELLAEICPERRIAGLPGTVRETANWLRKQGEVICRRVD